MLEGSMEVKCVHEKVDDKYYDVLNRVLSKKAMIAILILSVFGVGLVWLVVKSEPEMETLGVIIVMSLTVAAFAFVCANMIITSQVIKKRNKNQVAMHWYIISGNHELTLKEGDGGKIVACSESGEEIAEVSVDNTFEAKYLDEAYISKDGVTIKCSEETMKRIVAENISCSGTNIVIHGVKPENVKVDKDADSIHIYIEK